MERKYSASDALTNGNNYKISLGKTLAEKLKYKYFKSNLHSNME